MAEAAATVAAARAVTVGPAADQAWTRALVVVAAATTPDRRKKTERKNEKLAADHPVVGVAATGLMDIDDGADGGEACPGECVGAADATAALATAAAASSAAVPPLVIEAAAACVACATDASLARVPAAYRACCVAVAEAALARRPAAEEQDPAVAARDTAARAATALPLLWRALRRVAPSNDHVTPCHALVARLALAARRGGAAASRVMTRSDGKSPLVNADPSRSGVTAADTASYGLHGGALLAAHGRWEAAEAVTEATACATDRVGAPASAAARAAEGRLAMLGARRLGFTPPGLALSPEDGGDGSGGGYGASNGGGGDRDRKARDATAIPGRAIAGAVARGPAAARAALARHADVLAAAGDWGLAVEAARRGSELAAVARLAAGQRRLSLADCARALGEAGPDEAAATLDRAAAAGIGGTTVCAWSGTVRFAPRGDAGTDGAAAAAACPGRPYDAAASLQASLARHAEAASGLLAAERDANLARAAAQRRRGVGGRGGVAGLELGKVGFVDPPRSTRVLAAKDDAA